MTGFEPLIGAATAGLAGLISGLVQEKGGETLKRIDLDLGKNIAFKNALTKYVKRYIDRHGTLKVICVRMDEAVKLDEVYTAVQLLERKDLRYYESTESLQSLFQKSGQHNLNLTIAEKHIGIQVANEQQYLMVLGGPGVGKSTFLRKAGLEALRALGRPESLMLLQIVFNPQRSEVMHLSALSIMQLPMIATSNIHLLKTVSSNNHSSVIEQAPVPVP